MKKFILSMHTSPDGFVAGLNGEIDWIRLDNQLFVNPVLLGQGIPLFKKLKDTVNLKLVESGVFPSGVVELHYEIIS